MKKILIATVSLIALVSCGGGNQMYFDSDTSRRTDDKNAEFDTLSYALGMNIGLGLSLQNSHLELPNDLVCEAIAKELAKQEVDYDFLTDNSRLMSRFSLECSRPYQMAKRANAFKASDAEDAIELPELYNEEFTREAVAKMYGADIANYLRRMSFPFNAHWFFKAMSDATTVTSAKDIDSLMAISGDDVRKAMNGYVKGSWPVYNDERTREWLERVASQRGVNMMFVENDTLYYRVDVAGNGNYPQSLLDTVGFSYEVYTRAGIPVESTAKRLDDLRYNLDQTRNNNNVVYADSNARLNRINQIEAQIEKVENLRIPLSNSLIKGAQYAMKNVSEGGEITIWMPASLAYGERGNRVVGPNDGVVMRVKLKSVTAVTPEEGELQPGESKVTVTPAPADIEKPVGRPHVINVPVKK